MGIGRSIQKHFIRIEIDRIPFIGLQNGYAVVILAESGMCFEITDTMICCTYICHRCPWISLRIDKAISRVRNNLIGNDIQMIIGILHLKATISPHLFAANIKLFRIYINGSISV